MRMTCGKKEEIPKNKMLSQVEKKTRDSQFWSRLMEVKNLFLKRGRFVVQDGTRLDFGRTSGLVINH
jgi:hypothetical protein